MVKLTNKIAEAVRIMNLWVGHNGGGGGGGGVLR